MLPSLGWSSAFLSVASGSSRHISFSLCMLYYPPLSGKNIYICIKTKRGAPWGNHAVAVAGMSGFQGDSLWLLVDGAAISNSTEDLDQPCVWAG